MKIPECAYRLLALVKWPVFGLYAVLFTTTCARPAPQPAPAWFFWRTVFQLDTAEQTYLNAFSCRQLYVKFLDIARDPDNGRVRPYSLLEVADTAGLKGRAVVPCVFITNSVFQGLSADEQLLLARNTVRALQSVGRQFPDTLFSEIQIDCDWTQSTRDSYFSFLKILKSRLPPSTRLSATIRLHQYKFPGQTGVPPVDRGMLMFYNTGDIDDPKSENSIFTTANAEKYTTGTTSPYPLPLDVALAVFSWSVVYRNGEFARILPEFGPLQLADTARFEPVAENMWRVRHGTFADGYYLRAGDVLRYEAADVNAAAAVAARLPWQGAFHVAFFDLAPSRPISHPAAMLQSICRSFQSPEP